MGTGNTNIRKSNNQKKKKAKRQQINFNSTSLLRKEEVNQCGKKIIIENTEKQDLKLLPLVKVEQLSLLVVPKQKITNQTTIIEIFDKEELVSKNPVLQHTVVPNNPLLLDTVMMKIANYSQFRETVLLTKMLVNINVLIRNFLQVPKNEKERILFDLTTNKTNKIILDYTENLKKNG